MTSGSDDTDALLMAEALRLGERGLGGAAPNPSVGAVVVASGSGEIVGRGFTQAGGRPHAEFVALTEAGGSARGGTIYVTLEPCSHIGRGPACADAIIAAGIRRAVIAIGDPDQRVAGDGIDRLRAAGVEVTVGTLAVEARWLTLGHILRVTEGRPFVQLKIAVDRDGRTPLAVDGKPQFVTGDLARAEVHRLRAEADCILTGIGTVLADDPDLRPRLGTANKRAPIRVVLDRAGRLPWSSKLATTANTAAPVWQIVAASAVARKAGGGVTTIAIEPSEGTGDLDLATVLRRLATDGITRVMVEAGPTLAGAFLASGLVDEIVVIQSATVAAATGHYADPFAGRGLAALSGWTVHAVRQLGDDTISSYRR